ncbi:ABC transporter substrate-binding protein [Algoriphagus sediminis]|uniref:ABC transporter substrate-binding protein n=1 Tax=Algoriphagus sediminis TaxID=3057113 RepID=A0ABT7YA31_9BACT|nr:ABC transporter substrate-binding protein [Algoriphagus sediminis]MDN3203363.1 ABC transporter substrate-binding protein [Algoriphagus sediminis]
MIKFTITGVPEHFNYPWRQLIKKQPFRDLGLELVWKDESRGSGKMLEQLDSGETNIAIVLTESFFKRYEEKPDLKLLGMYVKSPLVWGIHTSSSSKFTSPEEISDPHFLISRKGSGSDLMSKVLADREGWDLEKAEYEIVNNLPGALEAMKNQKNSLFLWEKFTTKPFVDSGAMRRIGEIPSPWPCFVIATKNEIDKATFSFFQKLMNELYKETSAVQNSENSSFYISKFYHLDMKDIEEWKAQTRWQTDEVISKNLMENAIQIMLRFKILKSELDWKSAFVNDLVKVQ